MGRVTTLLFDCDNTLVLSESLAFAACAELANEILASRQIAARYTGPQLLREFVGQNFRGMMVSLQHKYGYDMSAGELEGYVSREEDQVIAKLQAELQPCVHVDAQLARLAAAEGGSKGEQGQHQQHRRYKMAVVSSSALRRVQASLDKVGQAHYFGPDVFSAATSLAKPTSKPDPAIYLHALQKLGVQAGESVAIEDSKSGTLSAVRAKIPVIAYVGSYEKEEQKKMGELLMENGAEVVMVDWNEFPACLEKMDKGSKI